MTKFLGKIPRDLRPMVSDAIGRGWVLEPRRGSGHFKLRHRSGQFVTVSQSPSDRRASLNLRSDIRRIERGLT